METQNSKSWEQNLIFFLNLMCIRFLADPKAAEIKAIKS